MYVPSFLDSMPKMVSANYEIDYFYYYKLNTNCTNTITISNPANDYYNVTPANLRRAVEKNITTKTVGSNIPVFNLSDNCTLRATDYVILDAGTTINATGTGQFSVIITPCPN